MVPDHQEAVMREIPIIFSGAMVRALLEGRKTQTRRLAHRKINTGCDDDRVLGPSPWQEVKPGDLLWVRETFSGLHRYEGRPPRDWSVDMLWYWAGGNPADGDWTKPKPGIHMPRWASRLTLEVTEVRGQQLRDLTDKDALAEGIWFHGHDLGLPWFRYAEDRPVYPGPRDAYFALWNELHGKDSHMNDPQVVALTFTVHQENIDAFIEGRKASQS